MKLAVIGLGAIGTSIVRGVASGQAGSARIVALADVPEKRVALERIAAEHGARWTHDIDSLAGGEIDLVVEAASQTVARTHAVALIDRGVDLMILSVGSLVDSAFFVALDSAARRAGRRVYLPAGAIGGLDALAAARVGGLDEVRLRTSKPPGGLAGAPFFSLNAIDLAALTEPTVIFSGSAVEAVRNFPANVNVAAAISLAGIGPERTRVEVVADPSIDRNVHEIYARGAFGEMTLRFANAPSAENPRTSLLACLSPLATIRRLTDAIRVG